MLPTLEDFGISAPVYIRKIDNINRWNPEGCSNIEERAKRVADSLFREDVYSLWKVASDEEFYGVIASLSARRNPKDQNIDFIWILEQDLQEVHIVTELKVEGDCLDVQELHYNARIDTMAAQKLCYNLIIKGREAKRCKRAQTKLILEYQGEKGCKATSSNFSKCSCQVEKDHDLVSL